MIEPQARKENYASPGGDGSGDDAGAMQRLQGGEDLALSDIIDRWRRPILSFLYRMTGNYEDSADLAQEVFVRIYRYRHKYRPSGSFSSFIFTIASNLAKNHLRWKKRHPETDIEGEVINANADPSISGERPSAHLEKAERGSAVRQAVSELPEKLRTPLILFHFQELSHSEISGILDCSVKTVETRIYRARKLLKKSLSRAELD